MRDTIDGIPVERFRYAARRYETLAYTGTMAQDVAASWSARFAMMGYMGAGLRNAITARRRFLPDLIHAHWWFPSGFIGAVASRASGTPLVTTLHGTDVRLARSIAASRAFFRFLMRRSGRVTTVSSWLASEVERMAPECSPEVAPMPVAVARYTPGGRRVRDRLLFVGRLNQQKGLAHALQALSLMPSSVFLDVVGDGKERSKLEALAAELGVGGRITWHGQTPQEDLLRHYRSAAVLVVPSIDEGLGLVAAEGLLCETPVVAFRSGGLTDVVEHERTGFLVSPGDHGALASAIGRVLAHPEEAARLARAGRISALSAFSPEVVARRYSGIYRDTVVTHAA